MSLMPREALRKSHLGIKLNDRSSKMEKRLAAALEMVADTIRTDYGLTAIVEKRIYLDDIVEEMRVRYKKSKASFGLAYNGDSRTYMQPDGGFMWIEEWGDAPRRFVLVAEAKRQGTNDVRKLEKKKAQGRGNAIERMGKNMRGVDALFTGERITPFVGYGEGCDFDPDVSSITDRVSTLNGFFPLNQTFVDKIQVEGEMLKPVSLYFREKPWTPREMYGPLMDVAQQAIKYYCKRYRLPLHQA
jgi:type II restriction enzyme